MTEQKAAEMPTNETGDNVNRSAFLSSDHKCPACGGGSLFVAACGYLTCARVECPNPTAAGDLLITTVPVLERKVLVGRLFDIMSTRWSEWEKPFEEVLDEVRARAHDNAKASGHPDEIIEVIVARRARVRAEITVELTESVTSDPLPAAADA